MLALLLIATVTAVLFVLRDELDTTLIALLYLIPLGTITAQFGLGPGITSALITFLTFNYFFIQPDDAVVDSSKHCLCTNRFYD